MNPSAQGWLNKLLFELEQKNEFKELTIKSLYFKLRACGFIYGSNQSIVNSCITNNDFTKDEICKINLIITFLVVYNLNNPEVEFTESVVAFYKEINQHKTSFFNDIINGKKPDTTLEKIIHKRIHIDDNILTKNFNYFITNALLFVDVLAYQHFLNTNNINETYIQHLEAAIETITVTALSIKDHKTKYDKSLIRLFESSLRYQQLQDITYKEAISFLNNPLEAQYVLDVACMATWTDMKIDTSEQHFLLQLGKDINIDKQTILNSIKAVDSFYTENKDNIALFTSKNVVKNFYDNSSSMVGKLISRNSKRLLIELKESKELMVLLSKSTVKELSEEEQKRVQDQLLDIFKSIPSLAIFLLPGGAILLPIVIKFIPKLLPSAFDDNRIDN